MTQEALAGLAVAPSQERVFVTAFSPGGVNLFEHRGARRGKRSGKRG
jgi:hypothetical protein